MDFSEVVLYVRYIVQYCSVRAPRPRRKASRQAARQVSPSKATESQAPKSYKYVHLLLLVQRLLLCSPRNDPASSMNIRDPFSLHRSPAYHILRGTATQAAANVSQRIRDASAQALETGRQAVEDMSFSIPKNVSSFSDPQRELENRVWGSSGMTARSTAQSSNAGALGSMQDRMGGFFDKTRGDLPMYKDKPYSYAASRRQQPMWKRRRVLGSVGLFTLAILWLLGFFSSHREESVPLKDRWNWLQKPEKSGSKVDWLERREKVKEAFTLTWDAYDRYAWGM